MRPATLVQLHPRRTSALVASVTAVSRVAVVSLVVVAVVRVGLAMASVSVVGTLFAVSTLLVGFMFFHHARVAADVIE